MGAGGGGGGGARVPASGRARLTPLFPLPLLVVFVSPSSFFAAAATSAAWAVAAVTAARGILIRSRCFGMSKPELGALPASAAVAAAVDAGGGGDGVASFVATEGVAATVVVVDAGSTLMPRSSSLGSLLAWGMLFGLTLRDWAALSWEEEEGEGVREESRS